MTTEINFQELAAMAAGDQDFTVVSSGGDFERELPEAGMCTVRFREYIELGLCSCASKDYPDKKPCHKARFVFEVTTPKHVKTITPEGKDSFRMAPSIAITCNITNSERGNFIKLFKLLNWEGKATHPAQLLGTGYLAEIVHAGKNKGEITADNPATYANLQKDGVFTIAAPRISDPLAETVTPIAVPELINDKKLFLWGNPNKACWDALHIAGTFEKEVKGVKQQVSKNWLQEKLMEALDFEGSPLFQMLNGGGLDLPTSEAAAAGAAEEKPAEEKPAETTAPVDPLAGLGV